MNRQPGGSRPCQPCAQSGRDWESRMAAGVTPLKKTLGARFAEHDCLLLSPQHMHNFTAQQAVVRDCAQHSQSGHSPQFAPPICPG